ncbi:hypothetical protein KKI23_03370 [Patescibacteria group bacterium]|nr:hypothetical protein [Patescibacteria group bacterium]
MKRFETIVLVGILLFAGMFVFGCSKAETSAAGVASNYFPHEDGYSWKYIDQNDSATISTIEGTTTINGNTVQIIKSSYPSSSSLSTDKGNILGAFTSTGTSYWRVTDDALYVYSSTSDTNPYMSLAFPLEIGKTWTIVEYEGYSLTAKVVANENVTVPAGTFNCYKVDSFSHYGTEEAYMQSLWIGDRAGLVRGERSGGTYTTELEWKNF